MTSNNIDTPLCEIVFLYGLPGAGKDTYAKQLMSKYPGKYVRVTKDIIREMLFAKTIPHSTKNEKLTLEIRDKIILSRLQQKQSVIVSDTNFPFGGKHYLRMIELAKLSGNLVSLIEKYINVTVNNAILRNNSSERIMLNTNVPTNIINNMYNKHICNNNYICKTITIQPVTTTTNTNNLPECVICDIDGTLSKNTSNRSPYDWHLVGNDSVVNNIKSLLITLHNANKVIIIFSGREDVCYDITKQWLIDNNIPFHNLFMRKSNDNRKDSIIKQELYYTHIHQKYYTSFILDDRQQVVDMWRLLGLTCLQVNYGDF